jgi:hypothetical protein
VRLLHLDTEDDVDDVDDDGADDASRAIELRPVGRQWSSRWERLEADLGEWRVPAC